jgi:hypothetical protein
MVVVVMMMEARCAHWWAVQGDSQVMLDWHSPSPLMLFFFTSFGDDILLEESGRDDEVLVATAAMMAGGDVAYMLLMTTESLWFGCSMNHTPISPRPKVCGRRLLGGGEYLRTINRYLGSVSPLVHESRKASVGSVRSCDNRG